MTTNSNPLVQQLRREIKDLIGAAPSSSWEPSELLQFRDCLQTIVAARNTAAAAAGRRAGAGIAPVVALPTRRRAKAAVRL